LKIQRSIPVFSTRIVVAPELITSWSRTRKNSAT
jgi:hypothetical protein